MNATTAMSRGLLDQGQTTAFSDWINSTRDAHPDLAQRLDLANLHFSELLSTRATMSEIEQKRDAAIASIRDYMREHQELIEPLAQLAEEYARAEWNQQEGEMVRLVYQGVMVDEIVDKAKEIIELDKSLGYMGEKNYQNLWVMETDEDSFSVCIQYREVDFKDFFTYQNGVVTLNEMSPQVMAKLKQLHTNAIAWEENFDNWKAELSAELEARKTQRNGDMQYHLTASLDVEAIASNESGEATTLDVAEEQQCLPTLAAREEEIDRQAVIDLAMKILDSNNGLGIFFDDLSVYGDRADNLGIDDGQGNTLFYSTPDGITINQMTAAHMQLLEDVLKTCNRFHALTGKFTRSQKADLLGAFRTTAEFQSHSFQFNDPLSEQEIIDIAMETIKINGEDIRLDDFSVYSDRPKHLRIEDKFGKALFSVIAGMVTANRMRLADMERLKGLVSELGLDKPTRPLTAEEVKSAASCDYIDDIRTQHPELSQRLDLVRSGVKESYSDDGPSSQLLDAIAAVLKYLGNHSELNRPLIQAATTYQEWLDRDCEMAWRSFQASPIDAESLISDEEDQVVLYASYPDFKALIDEYKTIAEQAKFLRVQATPFLEAQETAQNKLEAIESLIDEQDLNNEKMQCLRDEYKEKVEQGGICNQSAGSSKSELLRDYLYLDREQIRYTKGLIHQNSTKEVPDIHPEQENFQFVKTLNDLCLSSVTS